MTIRARELVWNAGGKTIVEAVSLDVRPGEFLGLIGPNGSGKTSLLSMLAGLREPASGEVFVGEERLRALTRRALAQRVAFVEQQADTTERITAREAVELGRTPHLSAFSPWSDRDDEAVGRALHDVGMSAFADRLWFSLSGGERQRLHIARALAQEADILLLDEPTNHLDVEHQIGLLDLLRVQRRTVVASLHDLNHAAAYCDRIAVMKAGRLVALGAPAAVLTEGLIGDVFKVDAKVEIDADGLCFIRFVRRPARPAHSETT